MHSDVEVRLNELRRTVDQQAVHSAALLKTVRVPPDEDKGGRYRVLCRTKNKLI